MGRRSIHAIVNPASGHGRTRREWPRLRAMIEARLGRITWEWTADVGHATLLARDALDRGCEKIISVGGDGTHHEIANAFLDPAGPGRPNAVLGAVPRGTGSDWTRSLGIPKAPQAAVDILARDRVASLDAGCFSFRDPQGKDQMRVLLNVTSLGIGGEVDLRVNRSTKLLGGFISFLWATLATLSTYRAKRVRYAIDGGPWREERIILIAVANGQYFGGGMWVAPTARLDDGLLDVVVVQDMNRLELIGQLPRLYKGTHLTHPKVTLTQARTLDADSPEVVRLDVDGEPLGTLPAAFRIRPGALRAVVGPGFRPLRV